MFFRVVETTITISWFITPSNYGYYYQKPSKTIIIIHSYWSYVHQPSYRLGAPHCITLNFLDITHLDLSAAVAEILNLLDVPPSAQGCHGHIVSD